VRCGTGCLLDRRESYRSGKLEEEEEEIGASATTCYALIRRRTLVSLQLVILGSLPDHSCALINHPYPRSVIAKHKRKVPPVLLAFRDVDTSAALPEVLRVVCGEGGLSFRRHNAGWAQIKRQGPSRLIMPSPEAGPTSFPSNATTKPFGAAGGGGGTAGERMAEERGGKPADVGVEDSEPRPAAADRGGMSQEDCVAGIRRALKRTRPPHRFYLFVAS
jgi:hypothetical protein